MTFLEPFLFAHFCQIYQLLKPLCDQNPEDTDWQSASMCDMKVVPKLDYPLYVPGSLESGVVLCRDGRGNERLHCGRIVAPQAGGGVIEQYPTIRGWGVIVTTRACIQRTFAKALQYRRRPCLA